jgi:membrane-associated phospholipid phosphatase
MLERSVVPPSRLRLFNLWVIGRASVRLNTFPSGHVATSAAVALSIAAASPIAGAVFGSLALLIAAASVAGRYHYLADALAGAGVALIAFAVSRVGG